MGDDCVQSEFEDSVEVSEGAGGGGSAEQGQFRYGQYGWEEVDHAAAVDPFAPEGLAGH